MPQHLLRVDPKRGHPTPSPPRYHFRGSLHSWLVTLPQPVTHIPALRDVHRDPRSSGHHWDRSEPAPRCFSQGSGESPSRGLWVRLAGLNPSWSQGLGFRDGQGLCVPGTVAGLGLGLEGEHMPCENPSPSTEPQPVTSHSPVFGQQGWNRLGLREETQLSQPGGALGRAPGPLPREMGDEEAVPAWNPG